MLSGDLSGGEWLAILWLKVVCTMPLKRPNWFACDCVPAAQSKSEKYLRRMWPSKENKSRFSQILAFAL